MIENPPSVSTSFWEEEARGKLFWLELVQNLNIKLWLKVVLEGLDVTVSTPMLIKCDNKATTHIANNIVFHDGGWKIDNGALSLQESKLLICLSNLTLLEFSLSVITN